MSLMKKSEVEKKVMPGTVIMANKVIDPRGELLPFSQTSITVALIPYQRSFFLQQMEDPAEIYN